LATERGTGIAFGPQNLVFAVVSKMTMSAPIEN
jgi:hypothetical protein